MEQRHVNIITGEDFQQSSIISQSMMTAFGDQMEQQGVDKYAKHYNIGFTTNMKIRKDSQTLQTSTAITAFPHINNNNNNNTNNNLF